MRLLPTSCTAPEMSQAQPRLRREQSSHRPCFFLLLLVFFFSDIIVSGEGNARGDCVQTQKQLEPPNLGMCVTSNRGQQFEKFVSQSHAEECVTFSGRDCAKRSADGDLTTPKVMRYRMSTAASVCAKSCHPVISPHCFM